MSRWDGLSNERCGMRVRKSGAGCVLVERMKRSTLRWFVHIEGMEKLEIVKVYLSSVQGPNRRGRPLGRWEESVKEYYIRERGASGIKWPEWTRRECMDRERLRSVCRGHPAP